jgi:pimeloyl-ACP methyl ester carboxylesterase
MNEKNVNFRRSGPAPCPDLFYFIHLLVMELLCVSFEKSEGKLIHFLLKGEIHTLPVKCNGAKYFFMHKYLKIIFRILIVITSFLLIIFIIRIIDPLNIKKYIYPGSSNRIIPKIGNGKLVELKNKNRIIYGYFSYKSEKLIILFHGNADTIYSYQNLGNIFYKLGYSILIIEYPGFGFAIKYNKSEYDIYNDCEFLIKNIQKNYKIQTVNTYLFGYSLGTGIATEILKRKLGNKMILVSPYTSISDVGEKNIIPILPKILINDNFDTFSKAKKIKNEVLLIHGQKDKYIPIEMSYKLHKAFTNSKIIIIKEAGHNAILYVTRNDIFNKIIDFLK